MLTKLWRALSVSTLLVFLATASLFAQDAAPYCTQLEAADCALLGASAEAMQDVHSLESLSTVSFDIVDIPEMPFDSISIRYNQQSAVSIDPEYLSFIKELQNMSPLEMEAMMEDPDSILELLESIFTGIDMSVEMDLELSDEILAMMNAEVRSELGVDLPEELGLQIRLIDGILYMDMTTIAEMIPELGMFVQGWVGLDTAPLVQMLESELAGLPDGALASDGPSELDNNPFAGLSMNQSGPLVTQVGVLDPSGEVYSYLNIERLAEGTDSVSFNTTMDYDAFMKSNAFRDLLYTIMTQDGATVTAAELDETITLAQIMAPAFLQDFFLEVTEVIAPSTGYMVGGTMTLDWDLKSVLTLAAQSDPSMKLDPEANPNVSMSSLTTNSSINEEITIEAPEGAFVVPMEMLMMLMNS